MIKKRSNLVLLISAFSLVASAQYEIDVEGIQAGPLILRPSVEASGAYDNRVLRSIAGGAKGDFYADTAAALEVVNWPSRYDARLFGRYGYRTYNQYTGLGDDFYNLAASLRTDDKPLLWSISSDYAKSLNYNILYDPATGTDPDAILTDRGTRLNNRASVSYDTQRFARTALVPSYAFQHYLQDYQDLPSDEWMSHTSILKLRYAYSAKAHIYGGAVYQFQSSQKEDGGIGSLVAGIQHRLTDKTSLIAELGYAVADYSQSGRDQSVVSNIRGNWRPMSKVGTYVFGGNSYQPGYRGAGARMVYRLGYGITWDIQKKYSLSATALHDYQEQVGTHTSNDPAYGTVRNFYDLKATYNPIERLALSAGFRLNDDQYDTKQTIFRLRAVYQFY